MLKKACLTLAIVLVVVGVAYARDVSVSNVSISNVDPGAETCSITYDLSRTFPPISVDQPIWVFVKYRLSTDDDFTGWQDTDDHDPSNDASDNNVDNRPNNVNANLSGDVGIVESTGSLAITWTWGASGTGLDSADLVRVRVYAVEMVKVGGGNYEMDNGDTNATDRLTGTTGHSANDYHLQKYPVTARMYADFLNACANRHDPGAEDNRHQFYRSNQLQANQSTHGSLTITGTVGTDAQWDTYNVTDDDRADRPIVYVTWYNAYDYCAWAGLNLPEEEHWYKVAGESVGTGAAQSDYYWGDTAVDSTLANFNSNVGNASDVNDYETVVDATNGGNVYGAYELSGNVFEWTDTDFYTGAYDAAKGPTSYSSTTRRVLRGGSWGIIVFSLRVAARIDDNPDNTGNGGSGFRCARALTP